MSDMDKNLNEVGRLFGELHDGLAKFAESIGPTLATLARFGDYLDRDERRGRRANPTRSQRIRMAYRRRRR